MIETCILGDVHLDKLRKYWPNANALQLNSYRKTIRLNKQRGIEHFFIAGDVADGIRDSTNNAMRLTEDGQCEFLKFLMDVDGTCNLHIILGNHDWAEQGSHSLQVFIEMQKLGMFKTIRFYPEPEVVNIDGVHINFLPFPHRAPTDKADAAVAHYEVDGTVSDSGRIIKFKESRNDDYGIPYMQGHLHTKQKNGRHHYGGTLYQTSFGESLPKGYAMARIGRGRFAWKFVPHEPPFKLENLHIYEKGDLAKLVNDPLHLFKLFVADDVRVPDNLLEKYPNIVNKLDFSSEEELAELEQAEFALENMQIEVNADDYLPDFFKSYGATEKQTQRAFQILAEYRGK